MQRQERHRVYMHAFFWRRYVAALIIVPAAGSGDAVFIYAKEGY
jgi:hypothetical protein